MTEVTTKGRELASLLNPCMGTTRAIEETCSLICRQATTYARIQEDWCCVEMSDRETARVEKRESQIEARIRDLAASLPSGDLKGAAEPVTVRFGGDPRGFTVALLIGNPSQLYNTWGGAEHGLGVPGS